MFQLSLSLWQRSERRDRRVMMITFAFTGLPVTTAEMQAAMKADLCLSQLSNYNATLQVCYFPKNDQTKK
jgi:hypothetical protein